MTRITNINWCSRMVFVFGVLVLWTLTVFGLVPSAAEGAVPQLINFQGILKDGSGNPVANGSYSVVFTIYNASIGGTVFWAETTSVSTTNGLFNYQLGTLNPIPDSAIRFNTWLGIKVGADPEMTPRPRLTSVSHAYKVSTVQASTGGTITGDVYLQGSGADDFLALTSTGDPNVAIELRSGTFGGTPYIDFSNDAVSDYDARIQLLGNDSLLIDAPALLSITGKASIGPGHTNTGTYAFVAGENNTVSGNYSTIGGGSGNVAGGIFSTVGGGTVNLARGSFSVVAGGGGGSFGDSNLALGTTSTIGGGRANKASGNESFIGGGVQNSATGSLSAVGGGLANQAKDTSTTVAGGDHNVAQGAFSTVPGGNLNNALGRFSFAAGRRAKAFTDGTFVWADSTNADFFSLAPNQFLIRASGGVGIGTNSPQGALDVSSTTGAFIVPRMTTAQRNALTAVNGMIIYNTDVVAGGRFEFRENGAWVAK